MGYFSNINRGIRTTAKGLSLTIKHLWAARKVKKSHNIQDPQYFSQPNGHVTLQYPHQVLEIPENGRYQLDLEMDDCIVCDKCAKVCPVDCIEIEPVKSAGIIRNTSDGSPVRLYAAKFDIDMAKCCFCGLCTTVCPTECLTMNSEYDYSVDKVEMLNFAFATLSPAEAQEKKNLYEQYVAEKENQKNLPQESTAEAKTGFKPKMVFPVPQKKENVQDSAQQAGENTTQIEEPKPAFVPKFKPNLSNKKADKDE
jgi:formate hydrogenlyase subunit 6/NADH:ubiquinone oxidoreductase subunit I